MAVTQVEVSSRVRSMPTCDVEIVVPVHNEERVLETSITTLRGYLDRSFPFATLVTIADNASSDGTWPLAVRLSHLLPGVRAMRLAEKGRGRALKSAWSQSSAAVVAYMDVDLSTGLEALLPLVAPLLSRHSDVAIGSRLARGAHVVRGAKRELISRTYNLIVRGVLGDCCSDAQCGFKAVRTDVARALLPLVADNEWFFDTELLVLARRSGLRIHEVPVDWVDDADSRVRIVRTAIDDLKGIARLLGTLRTSRGRGRSGERRGSSVDPAELARFAGVGTVSTVLYIGLFLALRDVLGALAANAAVLALCTVLNLAAHARFTFGARGPRTRRLEVLGGLTVFATSLLFTTVALLAAATFAPGSTWGQVAALAAGTALAGLVRFVALRAWIFRSHPSSRQEDAKA
jgi:putative flippase GtrA